MLRFDPKAGSSRDPFGGFAFGIKTLEASVQLPELILHCRLIYLGWPSHNRRQSLESSSSQPFYSMFGPFLLLTLAVKYLITGILPRNRESSWLRINPNLGKPFSRSPVFLDSVVVTRRTFCDSRTNTKTSPIFSVSSLTNICLPFGPSTKSWTGRRPR